MYEQSLNRHGIPSWLAQDPDRQFMVDEVNDLAEAVFEEADVEGRKGGGLGYGVRLVVLDKGPKPDPSHRGQDGDESLENTRV